MNNHHYKRTLFASLLVIVCTILLFGVLNYLEYRTYLRNYNTRINHLCSELVSAHPEISKDELMRLLTESPKVQENYFQQFSFDLSSDSVLLENAAHFQKSLLLSGGLLLVILLALSVSNLLLLRKQDKEIAEIAGYIERINRGDYQLTIDNNTEDGLSYLKNEVYKSTIHLKESSENSVRDKAILKESLSDISHQLKTPLTALTINLDNTEELLEDFAERHPEEADLGFCLKSLGSSRQSINHINSLVRSLLKLSKLDADAIDFHAESTSLLSLVQESVESVMPLADLREITVTAPTEDAPPIQVDAFWQKEAISNLLKNAVEHAETYVHIKLEYNKVYAKLSIENDGEPISEKDLCHVFERFYQGEKPVKGSDGIGLALSKAIIEKEGGYVTAGVIDGDKPRVVFTAQYNYL